MPAADRDYVRIGTERAGQKAEQRGLARGIGAGDAEQLAGRDFERHLVQRPQRAVGFAKPAHGNCCHATAAFQAAWRSEFVVSAQS